MDNLDRCNEIMQCIGRLWNARDEYNESVDDDLHTIIDNIKLIKAELLEPRGHGRWIVQTTWHGMFGLIHSECSVCKFDRNGDLSSWKFCPNCGTQMNGGADNG